MPDLQIKVLDYSALIAELHDVLHKNKPTIAFQVDGKLLGKQRHRNFGFINKNKKIQTSQYTPKTTVNYEQKVAMSFKEKCEVVQENTALFIEIVIHHEYPSTSIVKKLKMESLGIVPAKQPDVDNILKIIMDGLEKVAYQRDSLIVGSLAYKKYAVHPKVEAYIWEL